MSKQSTDLKQWYTNVSEDFQGVPREAVRFYNIETLPRLMHTLQQQKEVCGICASRFESIQAQLKDVGEWIKTDSPHIKAFQNELQAILKHLNQNHGIVAKGLWLSRITVSGILLGIVLAVIIHFFLSDMELHELLMLAGASGMIIGWMIGKVAESRLKKRGKIF